MLCYLLPDTCYWLICHRVGLSNEGRGSSVFFFLPTFHSSGVTRLLFPISALSLQRHFKQRYEIEWDAFSIDIYLLRRTFDTVSHRSLSEVEGPFSNYSPPNSMR